MKEETFQDRFTKFTEKDVQQVRLLSLRRSAGPPTWILQLPTSPTSPGLILLITKPSHTDLALILIQDHSHHRSFNLYLSQKYLLPMVCVKKGRERLVVGFKKAV